MEQNYGMVNSNIKLCTGAPQYRVQTHPGSWELLSDLYNDVYQKINNVVQSKKHVVIYLAFRGSKYRLKLDFSSLNGKCFN